MADGEEQRQGNIIINEIKEIMDINLLILRSYDSWLDGLVGGGNEGGIDG